MITWTIRLVSAVVLAALLAAGGSLPAHGQEPSAILTVSSHEIAAEDARFVATIGIDPGLVELGAVAAELRWDADRLSFVGCDADGLGVCNDLGGAMAFAGFAPNGLGAEPSFVTVEFAVVDRSAPTELILVIDTAVDLTGGPVNLQIASPGTVEFDTPVGSVNGQVIDGSGVAVYNAEVCSLSSSGDATCTTTNSLGAFVVEGLVSGIHNLVVTHPDGVLPPAVVPVEVLAPEETTGVVVDFTLVQSDENAGLVPVTSSQASAPPAANPGEIVIQVEAQDGVAIFGAEVCARQPLVGGEVCAYTDTEGVARIADLNVGNYELTASDPAGRWDPSAAIFVGVNPAAGTNAALVLPPLGLGAAPEELAFVDPDGDDLTSVLLASMAFALLGVGTQLRRRRS
ncbi:MAG: carboxypeptidase-like regulatory domain-containing protein [Actinomycetota bacterium]